MKTGRKIPKLVLGSKGVLEKVTGLLPSPLKGYIKSKGKEDIDREAILSVEFCHFEFDSERRLYLILTYENGFDILSVDSSSEVRKVTSVDGTSVKSIKFLPTTKNGKYKDKEPIIALISALDNQDFRRNQIKFYSLKTKKYFKSLTFSSAILTIKVTNSKNFENYLVIGTSNSLAFLSCKNFTKAKLYKTYPNPSFDSIFDVCSRFVSFPTSDIQPQKMIYDNKEISKEEQEKEQGQFESKKTKVISAAKDIISNIIQKNDETDETLTNSGVLKIIDFRNDKIISHFKAHKHSIHQIKFNPSGSLILTASKEGTRFQIFQIDPKNVRKNGILHRYTLRRGVTRGVISNVTFSPSSNYVIVSTTHGTSHLFAICPNGGEVNSLTHLPRYWTKTKKQNLDIKRMINMFGHTQNKHITYYSLSKIKATRFFSKNETIFSQNSDEMITLLPMSCIFEHNDKILAIDKDGFLNFYQLNVGIGKKTKNQQLLSLPSISIELTRLYTWDVCRKNSQLEYFDEFLDHFNESNEKQKLLKNSTQFEYDELENQNVQMENILLDEIETVSHFIEKRPISIGPQFRFCVFTKNCTGKKSLLQNNLQYKPLQVLSKKNNTKKNELINQARNTDLLQNNQKEQKPNLEKEKDEKIIEIF
ncbi:breast carcinoma-amplified sequence [Anaeramoeba flamelloides]|uniref:Breast carcinoma-amplified sequence n=1 Tax=Anaeramoeba flamelloides TaxID=1746091 RepID=A0AAV7ZF00_9EUKA|nr:breast carcinoma-amplified sequence [Anaeramoeba flamelloides]